MIGRHCGRCAVAMEVMGGLWGACGGHGVHVDYMWVVGWLWRPWVSCGLGCEMVVWAMQVA